MAIRAALVVAALMLATGAHAQSVCVLPASIQGGSGAQVGGKITSPVTADLKPNGRAPFSGNINIVFPQGEPATPQLSARGRGARPRGSAPPVRRRGCWRPILANHRSARAARALPPAARAAPRAA
jgi:hypothetical protein